ncbi:hypothetical protein PMAYCL1PPCAC_00988, partial [Pristionchus mayeri]
TTMDFFSLPDVFLRELMRKVDIDDRLRLRLTCRDFENLVATTHAGYFDSASIATEWRPNKIIIKIGSGPIIHCDENELEECTYIIRLFHRISIGKLT